MRTRLVRIFVFTLLLLASTTIYADGGNPIPWCPISCNLNAASR
jgi:hypothetical protein